MKILFLDIDGVLNSMRSVRATGNFPYGVGKDSLAHFDHIAVGLIKVLCEENGIDIVLSSSWRHSRKWQDIGPALGLPIIDRTPSLSGTSPKTGMCYVRGDEIHLWLDRHPNVKCYAIVDDDSDVLDSQLPYFVKTDILEGLTFADYNKLHEILTGKSDSALLQGDFT